MSVIPEMVLTVGVLSVGVRTSDIKMSYSRVEGEEAKSGSVNGSRMESGDTGLEMTWVE